MTKHKIIYISAGEASGDFLGANLAAELRRQDPEIKLIGMGGDKMRAAGVDIIFDSEKLSVMGFVEVLKKLPSILWTLHKIKKYLRETKPNAIVCIDLPDTHFRFFKLAKKYHISVFYYVSPQIWAWRYKRIYTLKKYIQHIGVLFQFEEKIYQKENIPVTFVGHPLAEKAKASMTKEAAYDFFHLDKNKKIVALFPGSRRSELSYNLQTMLNSVEKIRAQNSDTQFVLMLAPHFSKNNFTFSTPINVVQSHLYDLLFISDAAIAVSGTITLEIALMGVPLCVMYRSSPLSIWIAKKLVKTPYISLCNIVSEKEIAKEFIQENATENNIAIEISNILNDADYCATMKEALSQIKLKIARQEGVAIFASNILTAIKASRE